MGWWNMQRGLTAGAVLAALVAILGGILIPVGEMIIKGTVEKVRSSGGARSRLCVCVCV